MKRFQIVTMVLAITLGASAQAAVSTADAPSNRMNNRIGAWLGVVGDPSPSLFGVNAGYNLSDMFRATLGWGNLSIGSASATTIGAGMKAMLPGKSLTPTLGIHYAHVIVNGLGIGGFDSTGGHVYGSLGVDWQSKSGFFGGMGYNLSFRPGIGGGAYINLGWFFDFLGNQG